MRIRMRMRMRMSVKMGSHETQEEKQDILVEPPTVDRLSNLCYAYLFALLSLLTYFTYITYIPVVNAMLSGNRTPLD